MVIKKEVVKKESKIWSRKKGVEVKTLRPEDILLYVKINTPIACLILRRLQSLMVRRNQMLQIGNCVLVRRDKCVCFSFMFLYSKLKWIHLLKWPSFFSPKFFKIEQFSTDCFGVLHIVSNHIVSTLSPSLFYYN